MATDYDALYRKTPNALGKPTADFVVFFDTYPKPQARVLDVGCGQGRDALFIARRGHTVIGVDMSPVGIADLLAVSEREALGIKGEVADICTYEPDGLFDVIVIDRTLHMLNEADRHAVLERLLHHLADPGYLLIADQKANHAGFLAVLNKSDLHWILERQRGGQLFVSVSGKCSAKRC